MPLATPHHLPKLAEWLLGVCTIGFCLWAGVQAFWQAAADQDSRDDLDWSHLTRACARNPAETDYFRSLGDYWLNIALPPQPASAETAYRTALALNPYDSATWLSLGTACLRQGEEPAAERAYQQAVRLDPNNPKIRLDVGNFYFTRQEVESAIPQHAQAIRLDHGVARNLYSAYWGLGQDPRVLAQRLLPGDPALLRQYFLDSLFVDTLEVAADLWSVFGARPTVLDAACHKAYFDFLIAHNEFGAANQLWREVARAFYHQDWNEAAEPCWNGDFTHPLSFDGGLEWRISPRQPSGVQALVTREDQPGNEPALWIHFSGKENTQYNHVNHLLLLEPGTTYTLRCRVRGASLSTDHGPYVRLSWGPGPAGEVRSAMFTNSGEWAPELKFTAPADGHPVELSIGRDRIDKLNNKIQGDVWFKHFTLEHQTLERLPAPGGQP